MQVLELVQLPAPLFYTCFQPDHPNYCFVSAPTGNQDMNTDALGATEGQYLTWVDVPSPPAAGLSIPPPVPEPSTWALLAVGLLACTLRNRARRS